MTQCKQDMDMKGVDSALGDLVAAQLGLGKELLKVLGAGSALLFDGAKGLRLPAATNCCDIPAPCWMPKSLGEISCRLIEGDTGEVCLEITNEDFRAHTYNVDAAGPDAGAVQIAGTDRQFVLGPKERRTVSVRAIMVKKQDDNPDRAQSCCDSDDLDLLIWVRGCADHYLRWIICRDEKKSKACCHCVTVIDENDYELHWYDHFHVLRPCPSTAGKLAGRG